MTCILVYVKLTVPCRLEIDSIMRQADTDGDGKISYMEFVTMMNQRLYRRYI